MLHTARDGGRQLKLTVEGLSGEKRPIATSHTLPGAPILLVSSCQEEKQSESNFNLSCVCIPGGAHGLVICSGQIGMGRLSQDKALFPLNEAHLLQPAGSTPGGHTLG